MIISFPDASIYENGSFVKKEFRVKVPSAIGGTVRRSKGCCVFPAFCDVHVHLREPGFFYKETIKSGTMAAAHGGYTDIFSMPNLNPVPDSIGSLKAQLEIIRNDAVVNVYPYASITKGEKGEELSDFESLAELTVGFSDDGHGVQNGELMRTAMLKAKALHRPIVAHCEDNSLLNGGCIHDGQYAREHGYRGISSESEWRQLERDLRLAEETKCMYHVCHISSRESVELIRAAKARGVDVSCETAPHYLLLDDTMLQNDGRFKMNPPIRSESDRQALLEGIADGTIDMIATDHAPHSAEEKSGGLEKSLMGVTGLEVAFPVLYTGLVRTGIITLERLIQLMSDNPRKRFGLPVTADKCVFDLEQQYIISPEDFLSKGKSTPFDSMTVFGSCEMTLRGGKTVWIKE